MWFKRGVLCCTLRVLQKLRKNSNNWAPFSCCINYHPRFVSGSVRLASVVCVVVVSSSRSLAEKQTEAFTLRIRENRDRFHDQTPTVHHGLVPEASWPWFLLPALSRYMKEKNKTKVGGWFGLEAG